MAIISSNASPQPAPESSSKSSPDRPQNQPVADPSTRPINPSPNPTSQPKSIATSTSKSQGSGESTDAPAAASPSSILKPDAQGEEQTPQDDGLRPQRLQDYIGQKSLKEVLDIAIKAAKGRKEPLDHLLLYGPPGLGKTTLSLILATEMGVSCKITSAPALERPRDIVGLLVNLQPGDVLFIDEIHRLPRVTEEILYPAMEDFRIDVTIGKGQSARTRSVALQTFTLVGATTKVGALTSPLRDRFGLIQRLRFYELDELTQIILRTADILKTKITPDGAEEIGRRARGTPRIANRLLKRVRDFVQVKELAEINQAIAAEALELFNVDPVGLDWTDRRMLTMMIENFGGGPVGLDTLAAATGEDAQTIEEVYEPYLLQIGYLQRTPRGRIAAAAAWRHLGYDAPDSQLSILKT